MAFIRFWLLLLVVQTIIWLVLRQSLRTGQVRRLQDRWDRLHPAAPGNSGARRAFVRRAMIRFDRTLRMRLTVLVFVLPTVAVLGIVYTVNWQ